MPPSPSRTLAPWLAFTALAAGVYLTISAGGFGGALPAVTAHARAIPFRLDEYRITPATVIVGPGRIKLVATNTGTLTHNLRIESNRVDGQGNPIVLGTTPTAHPGETVFVKVRVGVGSYRLVCTIADHADLGQRGKLIVR